MRINSLNNNLNFGYSKQLSDKIASKMRLESDDTNLVESIIAFDSFNNSIEDRINDIETKTPQEIESNNYNVLVSMLLSLKEIYAETVKDLFPNLNILKKMNAQYSCEIAKDNAPDSMWRSSLCADLNDIDNSYYKESTSAESCQFFVNLPQESNIEQQGKNAVAHCDNITKFTPSLTSPTGFDSVIGLDELKANLNENIIEPINNPNQISMDFDEYGITRPRGYLLYGPPGCGKTFIVQALAAESGLSMYQMDISKIGSKYINETSGNIDKAFDFLENEASKQNKPVILFMDEVDSLAISRTREFQSEETSKAVTTLLKLVESARDRNIIVIGATNKYDFLDDAFKARFDGQYYVPLPDKDSISKLLTSTFSKRAKTQTLANSKKDIDKLSSEFKGFSNRSISFIIDSACKTARQDNRREVTYNDVHNAIEKTELQKVNEKFYKKGNSAERKVGFN